jgi:hypothetical protein
MPDCVVEMGGEVVDFDSFLEKASELNYKPL